MISNVTLLQIHLRLQELLGIGYRAHQLFGGVNVLFFRDLLQLLPVRSRPVYVPVAPHLVRKTTGSADTYPLWQDVVYDELTVNVRQHNDTAFQSLLTNVRVGKLSPADVELLLSRVVPPCGKDPIQLAVHTYMELEKQGCQPVILLPTLKRCQEVNDEMMKRFTTVVVCEAEDVID